MAEVLAEWLQQSPISLDEGQNDTLAMWMAENKDRLASVLKNGKLPEPATARSAAEQSSAAGDNVSEHPGRKHTKAA